MRNFIIQPQGNDHIDMDSLTHLGHFLHNFPAWTGSQLLCSFSEQLFLYTNHITCCIKVITNTSPVQEFSQSVLMAKEKQIRQ